MLVYMEKGDNTAMNSGTFTFSPQNTEASVNSEVKLFYVYIYMYVYNNLWLFIFVSSWWRWLRHRYLLLWHLCSRGERTRLERESHVWFWVLRVFVKLTHYFYPGCRWLFWRYRPTEIAWSPKRPSSMRATLWKILSWEWVSEISHVLDTQHHNKDEALHDSANLTVLSYFV